MPDHGKANFHQRPLLIKITAAALISTAFLLTGCGTAKSPPGTKRVETWGTKTTTIGGVKQTTNTHNVENVKLAAKGPEWAFKGIWHIQDYTKSAEGKRNCFVELFPAKLGDYNYRLKVTKQCPVEMRNIAAWRPVGEPTGSHLILVDNQGANIGDFDRVGKNLFRGTFVLTSGEAVNAHVKGW